MYLKRAFFLSFVIIPLLFFWIKAEGCQPCAVDDVANALIDQNNGHVLRMEVHEIGDWDMKAFSSKTIVHSVPDYRNIVNIVAMIRTDGDSVIQNLESGFASGSGYIQYTQTDIMLIRVVNGFFDDAIFGSTSYNRGWIHITYFE